MFSVSLFYDIAWLSSTSIFFFLGLSCLKGELKIVTPKNKVRQKRENSTQKSPRKVIIHVDSQNRPRHMVWMGLGPLVVFLMDLNR